VAALAVGKAPAGTALVAAEQGEPAVACAVLGAALRQRQAQQ
jgi:hypothetical protein